MRTSRLWIRCVGNRQTGPWTSVCVDVTRDVSWVAGCPFATCRRVAGMHRETSKSSVSRTIASIDEKPPFFNQYTRWMAMENIVTKNAQEPLSVPHHVVTMVDAVVSRTRRRVHGS